MEVDRRGVARCYHLVLFSSFCEFGAALESVGEEEAGEEVVSASQVAVRAVATEEAVRRYIRSQPALKSILSCGLRHIFGFPFILQMNFLGYNRCKEGS